jgi:hypothetical protein
MSVNMKHMHPPNFSSSNSIVSPLSHCKCLHLRLFQQNSNHGALEGIILDTTRAIGL